MHHHYAMFRLLMEIVIPSGIATILAWVGYYSWQAKWWDDAIGQTLVVKDVLIVALMALLGLPLFFPALRHSLVLAWLDVVLVGLVTPVMIWRTEAWARLTPPEHSLRRAIAGLPANMRHRRRERRERKARRDGDD